MEKYSYEPGEAARFLRDEAAARNITMEELAAAIVRTDRAGRDDASVGDTSVAGDEAEPAEQKKKEPDHYAISDAEKAVMRANLERFTGASRDDGEPTAD